MKNPFNFKDEHVEKPQRSNFDLSHTNHGSFGFGKIYPVFHEMCYPGDSFDIESAFGLDAMPMVFPVQSGVRAYLHFHWVPLRILWKNWTKYYAGTDDSIIPPFIDLPTFTRSQKDFVQKFFSSGSLSDYLDVPTTLVGKYGQGSLIRLEHYDGLGFSFLSSSTSRNSSFSSSDTDPNVSQCFNPFNYYSALAGDLVNLPPALALPYDDTFSIRLCNPQLVNQRLSNNIHPFDPTFSAHTYGFGFVTEPLHPDRISQIRTQFDCYSHGFDVRALERVRCDVYALAPNNQVSIRDGVIDSFYHYINVVPSFLSGTASLYDWNLCELSEHTISVPTDVQDLVNFLLSHDITVRLVFHQVWTDGSQPDVPFDNPKVQLFTELGIPSLGSFLFNSSTLDTLNDLSELDIENNPFVEQNGSIPRPLSALPYRAYEAICNCYYRNQQVDPFIKNGMPEYNEWVTNDGDGSDSTPYDFFYRNWELDAYTGALPSPQQGVAPLVGMTALGNVSITDENGTTTAQATIDDDGTITDVVLTSPAASVDHARTAMNIASAGMSINDFRSTNSLQRFLEKSIRKGYRYADQILSHFGVSPKYNELDMPQFLGGVSLSLDTSKVLNNNGDGNTPLGSFAGIGQIVGKINHNIRHYCDEHGFIMATLCITPTPSYSQLLPKHFTFLNNRLDYFSPEFSNIGMQPITFDEICPLQAYQEELQSGDPVLSRTFGYQRPFHEMVRRVDTVHSQMRTSLRDYLINRVFDFKPELSKSFIQCDPRQCNNIFTVQLPNDDKFVGQVSFKITAKRPLPRTSLPCLE